MTDRIKFYSNLDETEQVLEHEVKVNDELDDLEYLSFKELESNCASTDDVRYQFLEFWLRQI